VHLSGADLLGMILRRDAYMIGEGTQKVKYFKIVAIFIAVGESLIFSFEINSIFIVNSRGLTVLFIFPSF
jgi:hypothetical protein